MNFSSMKYLLKEGVKNVWNNRMMSIRLHRRAGVLPAAHRRGGSLPQTCLRL